MNVTPNYLPQNGCDKASAPDALTSSHVFSLSAEEIITSFFLSKRQGLWCTEMSVKKCLWFSRTVRLLVYLNTMLNLWVVMGMTLSSDWIWDTHLTSSASCWNINSMYCEETNIRSARTWVGQGITRSIRWFFPFMNKSSVLAIKALPCQRKLAEWWPCIWEFSLFCTE